jgi:hypothetical protein
MNMHTFSHVVATAFTNITKFGCKKGLKFYDITLSKQGTKIIIFSPSPGKAKHVRSAPESAQLF